MRNARRSDQRIAALGTVAEWYDFLLFAYLATILARVYFPDVSPTVGLLSTFAAFAAGYVLRPVGALFWGSIGDRFGRKKALVSSLALMAPPMLILAVLPGYATIGIWAPIGLAIVRLVQGFMVAGETAGAIVVLVENAPATKRGLLASYAQVTMGAGILLAAMLAAVMTDVLPAAAQDAWGWRLLYVVGAIVALAVAAIAKRKLDDYDMSERRIVGAQRRRPIHELFANHRGLVVRGTLLAGFSGVAYYMALAYYESHLTAVAGVSQSTALWVAALGVAVWGATSPLFGWMSDRYGRKPILRWSCVGLIVCALPAFWLGDTGSLSAIIAGQVILAVGVAAYSAVNFVQLGEIFRRNERFTGVATTYNIGQSLFGSTAPAMAAAGLMLFHSAMSPAIYLAAWALLALIVGARLAETAFMSLRKLDGHDDLVPDGPARVESAELVAGV